MHRIRIVILLFISLLTGVAGFAQTNKEKASLNATQALLLEDSGYFDKAIPLLQESIMLDPDSVIYPYELAVAYYAKEDYTKAQQLLEGLLSHKDLFGTVYQVLGNTYDKTGRRELALETYRNGLDKFPNTGELYLEIGNMYLAKKAYDTALAMYERGIEVNPGFPSNYYWAAKIYCNSDEAVWGMLYGEIFMILERNTRRLEEMGKLLFNTYKKCIRFPKDSTFSVSFSPKASYPGNNGSNAGNRNIPFAKNIYEPTLMLAMLREKTVDLATICRIRKYFIEFYIRNNYYQKYPNPLFDFQYRVLKAGFFDAYSHWILYSGDEAENNAWIAANKQEWALFIGWFSNNKLLLDAKYRFHRSQY